MSLGNWFRRLFGLRPREMTEVPAVMGEAATEEGKRVALQRGPVRHSGLSDDQVARVARLREVLAEAYPMTMEGWIDGFLRDADPESEIRIIEACAVVYRRLTGQCQLWAPEKKRLYAVLCALSAGADGPQLAGALPGGKGLPDVGAIVEMYRQARQSEARP